MLTPEQAAVCDARDLLFDQLGREPMVKEIADHLGISANAVQRRKARAKKWLGQDKLESFNYDLDAPEKTPAQAWSEHAGAFEQKVGKLLRNQWRAIKRGKGPFCIFHSTDEHLDDDATPLRLIESDIKAAHDLDAIMCHGGDALNNWPMAGRLAKQWAEQQCTAPDAILRLKHFIEIFEPDVWTDGNHEDFSFYLNNIIKDALPKSVIQDYWTVNFKVETPGGRDVRAVMSHKFQKGSSWFHPHHGVIREMLEGQEADLLLEGHLHISGSMYRSLPERGLNTLGVASAGYKVVDRYAARISRGGKVPKLKGRAHWIVADPLCDDIGRLVTAFDCPLQAEAYMNGLQNIREV